MARRGSRLAERMREALAREEGARSVEEKERMERLEASRIARRELFDDLAAFGAELGFVKIEREEAAVTLARGDRWLRFGSRGEEGEVEVDFSGRGKDADHRLYRESVLDDRWIWVRRRRNNEDRIPLFDEGLEILLTHALELPLADSDPVETKPVRVPSGPDDGGPDVPAEPEAVKRKL